MYLVYKVFHKDTFHSYLITQCMTGLIKSFNDMSRGAPINIHMRPALLEPVLTCSEYECLVKL